MKPAGPTLLLLLTAGSILLRAQSPVVTPTAAETSSLSPQITPQASTALPAFVPPATATEIKPANAPNPDVLELPKMKVQQKKRPRLTPEVMLTTKAFNETLAHDKLSSFDRDVLNRFTLPLFGASAADRAREEFERAKREQLADDVLHLAKISEVVDPAQAKTLRDAVNKP